MMKTFLSIGLLSVCLLVVLAVWRPKKAEPIRSGTDPVVAADAARLQGTPVVVELFTSEGCSSCPPADEVLSQLAKTQPVKGAEVIALGQHVDYWNQLGWADPYSAAEFSTRQGVYAEAFGRGGVYTPQMVVDGKAQFVGSDIDKARAAIASAAQAPKAKVQAAIAGVDKDTVRLSVQVSDVPVVSQGDVAEVMVAITEDDLQSSVTRGENSGRNLRHAAVVRQLETVGTLKTNQDFGSETRLKLDGGWKREKLRAVVFVQERTSRKVLGASSVELGKG
jgi:hypothetical protein